VRRFGKPWNSICKRDVAIDKVIDNDKIPFEILLKKAQDQGKTVAVTMKNGKIYIGFVIHLFNPALPTNFIQILPTKSGYRNEKTRTFEFTTPYLEALDNIDRDFDQKASRLFDVETMLNDAKEHNASDERVKALEAEIEKLV